MLREARAGSYDSYYSEEEEDVFLPMPKQADNATYGAAAAPVQIEPSATRFEVDEDSQSIMGLIQHTTSFSRFARMYFRSIFATLLFTNPAATKPVTTPRAPLASLTSTLPVPAAAPTEGPPTASSFVRKQSFLHRNMNRLDKMAAISTPTEARSFVFRGDATPPAAASVPAVLPPSTNLTPAKSAVPGVPAEGQLQPKRSALLSALSFRQLEQFADPIKR